MTAPASPLSSVGIVGLGVIGGSIAKDLAALGVRVAAYDRDATTLARARDEGTVLEALDDSLAGLAGTDVVVVAVPGDSARRVLRTVAPLDCAAITDVGSTKSGIVEEARRLKIGPRFVGAHPLAGDHRSGWAHARRGLFAGAISYLCATPETRPATLERVQDLWRRLGATIVALEPRQHDALLAWSSHLPHAAASAIALVLARAGVGVSDLGPGGRDVTRIAGASPELWTSIVLENADALLPAIEALRSELGRVTDSLRNRDEQPLREFFAAAQAWTVKTPPRS